MIPLKQEKILDDQQVDTIFFKVQELLMYHMSFLNTLQMWELTNTVGDKLLDMVILFIFKLLDKLFYYIKLKVVRRHCSIYL